jgi:hypothetical protein
MRLSWNWKLRTRRVAQGRRNYRDLEGLELSHRSIRLLDPPIELLSEVGFDDRRFQRSQAGVLGYSLIEMYEPLLDDVSLVLTIRAKYSNAVNIGVMCTDKVRANEPFFGVLWHCAEEDGNGEAHAKFVLVELNTDGPFPKDLIRWDVLIGVDSWAAAVVMTAGYLRRLNTWNVSPTWISCFALGRVFSFLFYGSCSGGRTCTERRGRR